MSAASDYGRVVVGVSATASLLAWSVRSAFALFYIALLAEVGWGCGAAAVGYSLSWLLLFILSPVASALYDRWGARVMVSLGGALLGAAPALSGQVATLWQYYLAFGVLGRGRHRGHPDARGGNREPLVRAIARRGDGRDQRRRVRERDRVLPGQHVAHRHVRLAHGVRRVRADRRCHHDPARGRALPRATGESEVAQCPGDHRVRLDARDRRPQRSVLGRVRDVGPRRDRLPNRDHAPGGVRRGSRLRARHDRVGVRSRWRAHGREQPRRRLAVGSLGT